METALGTSQWNLSYRQTLDAHKAVTRLAASFCGKDSGSHFQEIAWHHAVLTSVCDVVKRSVLTSLRDHSKQRTEAGRAKLNGKRLE